VAEQEELEAAAVLAGITAELAYPLPLDGAAGSAGGARSMFVPNQVMLASVRTCPATGSDFFVCMHHSADT
jgi:hypothetical protein